MATELVGYTAISEYLHRVYGYSRSEGTLYRDARRSADANPLPVVTLHRKVRIEETQVDAWYQRERALYTKRLATAQSGSR